MKPTLSTLVYCLRGDEVLLMERYKEPNLGLWIAPGGKVEMGESPYECARRELGEETGLQAHKLYFRGLVSLAPESSLPQDWQWLMFLYATDDFSGDLSGDEREGDLRWIPLAEAHQLPMPQADQVYFWRVTDLRQPFYQAKFVYDADRHLKEVIEQPVSFLQRVRGKSR
jgi:8-oxo-dGTP diphosphatase